MSLFFSVIVVCRNPGPPLRSALESVWAQENVSRETVVIDGGSTDGSREWLESQRDRIATLVSEPDRGVYDAMNKGLAAARGEWVLFLGADDRLAGDTILADAFALLSRSATDVGVGEAVYDDGRAYRFDPRASAIARNFVHHQAAFYRRTVLAQQRGFDANLAIMGDYDLNLRLRKQGARFVSLPLTIARCGSGGLSDAGEWRGYAEEIQVRHRHFSAGRCWGWDAGSVVRYLRKKIVRLPGKVSPIK